jgi:type VI secretion system protein ImpC
MATNFSFGNLQFEVGFGPGKMPARDPEAPFNLAVLGDFSGRANRGLREPIGQRRVWAVDCDNFEDVMGELEVGLRPWPPQKAGDAVQLHFAATDDFHPDQLLKQVTPLAVWLEQRKRLLNPSMAAAATAELQRLLTPPSTPAPAETTPARTAETNDETLARLLGGAPQRPAPVSSGAGAGIERLIKNIVAPSIVPGATPQQAAMLAAVDLELGNQLRSLLHDREFQALEAAWRGADLLVRTFGGGEQVRLFLLDVSQEELAADLQAQEGLESSGIARLLRRQAENQPWATWLGLYTFGEGLADMQLLGRLAKVASLARAPFISGASPGLVGCDSFDLHPDPDDWKPAPPLEAREAWQALRQLPEASALGLALPRFLLRQPYGKDSDAIESFPFEELPGGPPHESYLWGNPAILCGYLLAEAFQAEGWKMQASGYGEFGDLPVHKFKEDGETKVKPCGEAWLSERAAQAMLSKGLMPVLSVRGRNAVRLEKLGSVAGGPLALG